MVEDLNIKTPTIDTMVTNLSGGNQQKVVIGKFLLTEIVLFLLDEPTRGIDVGAKAEIYQLVGQLAQQGTGFLLVSSELPELLAVCDRIYVLCDGRLTGEFERERIRPGGDHGGRDPFRSSKTGDRIRPAPRRGPDP